MLLRAGIFWEQSEVCLVKSESHSFNWSLLCVTQVLEPVTTEHPICVQAMHTY